MQIERNPPLAPLHTFGLVATADTLCRFSDVDTAAAWLRTQPTGPRLVLGQGSNTLFVEPYAGLVIKPELTGISAEVTTTGVKLTVAAGENWHQLVRYTVAKGWGGLENLALIPGTVGAAPVQNIGAYGREFADFCTAVEALDISSGARRWFTAEQCQFAYRQSFFKSEPAGRWLIIRVQLWLPQPWTPKLSYQGLQAQLGSQPPTPQTVMDAVVHVRQQKLPDPAVLGNAGSFFKNPEVSAEQAAALLQQYPAMVSYAQPNGQVKLAAGWLIEQLGLKSVQVGQAGVHDEQALVLVNHGGATSKELVTLAWQLRRLVSEAYGVVLEPEVRLIGRSSELTLDEAYGIFH